MVSVVPQVFGITEVFTKQLAEVEKVGPLVDARPFAPVSVVNETEPPGITDLDSEVAEGGNGGVIDGVIVAKVF